MSVSSLRQVFIFIFLSFYYFWWCVSLIFFDILLVQWLGVMDMFVIIIYTLFQKKKKSMIGRKFLGKSTVEVLPAPQQFQQMRFIVSGGAPHRSLLILCWLFLLCCHLLPKHDGLLLFSSLARRRPEEVDVDRFL